MTGYATLLVEQREQPVLEVSRSAGTIVFRHTHDERQAIPEPSVEATRRVDPDLIGGLVFWFVLRGGPDEDKAVDLRRTFG